MKIWLLEDNEKTGPYETYIVRDRVANGELEADTPAWYDGADDWVTLADVPTMISAFPKVEEEIIEKYRDIVKTDELPIGSENSPPTYRHGVDIPENLIDPPKLHPVQRLCARMIDVILYMLLVSGVKLYQGIDIFHDFLTPTQHFFYHAPYFVIDGLMMHIFGTTIGKYFLDIKVKTAAGERLQLGASLLRSARVWVIGLGMFTILMPLSFLFSWLISRKFGKFLWDLPKNTQVEVKPPKPLKIVMAFVLIMSASHLLTSYIPDEIMPKGTLREQAAEIMKGQQRSE